MTAFRRGLSLSLVFVSGLLGTAAAQEIPPDFRVAMKTGGCLGDCASYRVQVDAAGRVRFDGTFDDGVLDPGPHEFTIPQDEVRLLLQRLDQLDFFSLADRYETGTVTDLQAITYEVTHNGRTKQVFDYDGGPPALNDLAGDLARLGQASRWVVGNADDLREFLRRHPAPPARTWFRLGRKAIWFDAPDLLRQVLDFGLPTADLADLADEARTIDLLNALLAAGAPPERPPDDDRQSLLMNAAERGDLARVNRLLAAGASVDRATEYGETALWFAACGLHHEVVARLLSAGANPDVESTLTLEDTDPPLSALGCPGKMMADLHELVASEPPGTITYAKDSERAAEKTVALIRQALLDRASPRRPR